MKIVNVEFALNCLFSFAFRLMLTHYCCRCIAALALYRVYGAIPSFSTQSQIDNADKRLTNSTLFFKCKRLKND